MADAWGGSWGSSWGASWGAGDTPPVVTGGGGWSHHSIFRRKVRDLLDEEEEDEAPPPPAPETKRKLEKGLLADLLAPPETAKFVKREVAKIYVHEISWSQLQAGYDSIATRLAKKIDQDDDDDAILLLM